MQKVTYFFAPLSSQYHRVPHVDHPFHCKLPPFQTDRDGFQSFTLENMPAFHDRADDARRAECPCLGPGFLYGRSDAASPKNIGPTSVKSEYNRYLKPAMKANDEIKDAAATATSDAKTDDEKVLALIRYIRKNLRDLFGSQSHRRGARRKSSKRCPRIVIAQRPKSSRAALETPTN